MIRQLHDALWVIDFPLKMPGGIQIGTRTTLVRLGDGKLFVHSPGPAEDAEFDEIAKLGDLATFYAPPNFEQKVAGLSFETLVDRAPVAWSGDLDQIAIPGAPRLNEIVFCHRPSRTLILTDLCFNLRHSDSLITRVVMSLMGGYGHFGPSRLARTLMKDKAAVKAGVGRILALDFDRVIVAHGEVLESGGPQALREAFAKVG
jgi:hypothetical protein